MIFENMVVTENGRALLEREPGEVKLTRMAVGKGKLRRYENPRHMAEVAEPVGEETVGKIKVMGAMAYASRVALGFRFGNQKVKEDFLWTELGLYALNAEGKEVLYAYGYEPLGAALVTEAENGVREYAASVFVEFYGRIFDASALLHRLDTGKKKA